jgi:hypothetical protein
MLQIVMLIGIGTAALMASQLVRRSADEREAKEAWNQLASTGAAEVAGFDPAMVSNLPEPARRYFLFAIEPGARLRQVAEINMDGLLSLGTQGRPNYQPMQAKQMLAPPHGFVWRVRAGSGAMHVAGSDGMTAHRSWTRFWLLGAVPVARVGGDMDHLRSSFGRMVAEAAFWVPASLLPQAGVTWEALDADTARATVVHGRMRQQLDIRVDGQGQPLWISMPQWSNANPEGVFREQPFGGELSDFRSVEGFKVPFQVDGGNFFGTSDYFPFYRARVGSLKFL